jgi:hypothetical protein
VGGLVGILFGLVVGGVATGGKPRDALYQQGDESESAGP